MMGKTASKSDTSPPGKPLQSNLNVSYTNTTITINTILEEPKFAYEGYYLCSYQTTNNNWNKTNLICNCSITTFGEVSITIENSRPHQNCSYIIGNITLNQKTLYNFTVVLGIGYKNKTSFSTFDYIGRGTLDMYKESGNLAFYGLLLLLLIVPIAIFLVMYKKKILCCKNFSFRRNSPVRAVSVCNYTTIYSKPIKLSDFNNYVKESVANRELERQHGLNMYTGSNSYEHTKVVLEESESDKSSNYINANYIDGYKTPKAYIATQRPTQATRNDFWRMIWQKNVKCILLLSSIEEDEEKKEDQYWPNVRQTIVFGEVGVRYVSSTVFTDYESRIFKVIYKESSRKVQQLHFFSWPNHGVPLYSQSLIPFLKKILFMALDSESPIIVQSSAGFGRAGTLIMADNCARIATETDVIDVLKNFQELRNQRLYMIENVQQYILAHLLILECLVGLDTAILCSEIETKVEKIVNYEIDSQLLYLDSSQWQEDAIRIVSTDKLAMNVPEKNRFPYIIPEILGKVYISYYPVGDESSAYINAVKVDGFRSPGQFIVTQQPLPTTLGDFWRLIDEHEVSVIISLNDVDVRDKTSCNFWPTITSKKMIPIDYITLTHLESTSSHSHSLTKLKLRNKRASKQIFIITPSKWESYRSCPKDIHQFLTFWKEAKALSRQSKPVVVTCFDGATASGLYIAMSFIIEKINLEQVCDVCQAVRTIRCIRPQFVNEKKHFEFLYKMALAYMRECNMYANFNEENIYTTLQ